MIFGKSRICTVALALGVAIAFGGTPAGAESFTIRIASGHAPKPLTPVNAAKTAFVPNVTARVEAETEHTVRFIETYAGTVASMFETLEATQKGLVDIGLWCVCFEPAKAAILNFNYFIPFSTDDPALSQKIARQIYEEFPIMTEILEKRYSQKFLGIAAFDDFGLGTTFEWTSPADLKGHKIGGGGPNLPWIKFAGATPVQTKLPEAYNAMQSGIYDGLIMFPATWWGLKFYEVAPYFTKTGWGSVSAYIMTMNLKRFNGLPASIQKILTEEAVNWEAENARQAVRKHAFGLKKLKEAGSTVRVLSGPARAELASLIKDWPNQKAKELDKADFPGTKLFKRYLEIAKENGVKFPVEYVIR